MSTKLNARSPFYLSLTEPTQATETFTCTTAGATGFVVDSNGTITLPTLTKGTIVAQSDDSFAPIASDGSPATRNLTLTIQIPAGFTNTDVGTIPCVVSFSQQPAAADPSSFCPGTTGTIANQSLANTTGTATVAVNTKFTAGSGAAIAGFRVINNHTSFVTASIDGNNLVLSALGTCGTKTIQVEAFQNSSSCTAVQDVQITITGCVTLGCTLDGESIITGGHISQDGATITAPNALGTITKQMSSSGGGAITSVAANSSANAQNVTLFYNITVPNGFDNAGATIECSIAISQDGTGQKAAACPSESGSNLEYLQFSNFRILTDGSVIKGNVTLADVDLAIVSYTSNYAENTTTSTIPRTLTVVSTIPSGYSNTGSKSCDITINQEAALNPCGTNELKRTAGVSAISELCDSTFPATTIINSTQAGIGSSLIGKILCNVGGSKFQGGDLFYAISTVTQNPLAGPGLTFDVVKINNSGTVTEFYKKTCATSDDTSGAGEIQF